MSKGFEEEEVERIKLHLEGRLVADPIGNYDLVEVQKLITWLEDGIRERDRWIVANGHWMDFVRSLP